MEFNTLMLIQYKEDRPDHIFTLICTGIFDWESWKGQRKCDSCHDNNPGPMLKTEVWKTIGGDEVLCEMCMKKKLGREILLEDLNDSPWNYIREKKTL